MNFGMAYGISLVPESGLRPVVEDRKTLLLEGFTFDKDVDVCLVED